MTGMYLILGDKGAVMFRTTLGCDVYHLESQCAVYIPAGLPHAIEAERFTEGAYGGSCQIYLDKNYVTKPVPDEPLKADDTESLIVRDIQWVESLPDHEGSVGGKGFTILMNGSLVPQANAWVCPTLFLATQRQVRIVEAGTGPKANPHIKLLYKYPLCAWPGRGGIVSAHLDKTFRIKPYEIKLKKTLTLTLRDNIR